MTSARKIAANRANARRSTGPKTILGRARATQNALRHGFSRSLDGGEHVDALAKEIAGACADAELLEHARAIAQAQLDLTRVRLARQRLLMRVLSDPSFDTSAGSVTRKELKLTPEEKFAAVLLDRKHGFAALERYEQRAFSRRTSAARAFDAARARKTPMI
jgi:hypothetical protein